MKFGTLVRLKNLDDCKGVFIRDCPAESEKNSTSTRRQERKVRRNSPR